MNHFPTSWAAPRMGKWLAGVLLAMPSLAWSATPLQPLADHEVLEVLPAITRQRPLLPIPAANSGPIPVTAPVPNFASVGLPEEAARAARAAITLARQTGDTRHWGRAQAQLAPWWGKADAPVEVAVLQATVQQGRHEFAAARAVLAAALKRAPGHAQGWLNLAALERLSGQYAASLAACKAVAAAGQALYATACELETQSLLGQHRAAKQGLDTLLAGAQDSGQRAWLASLLAESLERAGDDKAALAAYQRSLADEPDLYTAIAFSDLHLRNQDWAAALRVLAPLVDTDAVLLRRATAWRAQKDARWKATLAVLQARTAELVRRGDNPALHGRESALVALWLEDDAARALADARQNLRLQREPVDWWVALHSARRAKDAAALAELTAELKKSGLQDARLHALTSMPLAGSPAVAQVVANQR